MLIIWNAWYLECLVFGMLGIWNAWYLEYSCTSPGFTKVALVHLLPIYYRFLSILRKSITSHSTTKRSTAHLLSYQSTALIVLQNRDCGSRLYTSNVVLLP